MNPRDRFEELLNGYAENALTTEEQAELELLLRESPEWREEADQERELVAMLRSLRGTKAPAALHDAVLAGAASAEIKPVEVRKSARSLGLWQLGAAAAIFIGGLVVYSTHEPTPLPVKSGVAVTQPRLRELDAVGRKERANEAAGVGGEIAGAEKAEVTKSENLFAYNPTEGTVSNGDVRRAKDAVSADTSVDKLADFEQNAVGAINAEAKRADLSVLKEATDEKQLSDNRAPAVAPAPAAAVANKPDSPVLDAFALEGAVSSAPAGSAGAPEHRLYFDRNPSYGNTMPEKEQSFGTEFFGRAQTKEMRDAGAFSIPSQIAANFSQLPTRQQVEPVILANRGSIVVDTPWYKTATEYLSEGGAYTQLGYASNTRYLVVDFDKPEEATKTQQQVTQKALPQEILQLARVGDDTRVLIPYQAGQAIQAQAVPALAAAAAAPAEPAKPAENEAKLFAKAKKTEATMPPASTASAMSAPDSVEEARGRRNAGQLETARAFGTFDEFDAHVRKLGAQFLFYTEDRVLAFTEEAGNVTSQTPTADKPFTGYLVYHFASAAKADAAIQQITAFAGEGVRNVGVTDVELVRQPDGVRLILPYRMEQNR
jgi:hypothetical protein